MPKISGNGHFYSFSNTYVNHTDWAPEGPKGQIPEAWRASNQKSVPGGPLEFLYYVLYVNLYCNKQCYLATGCTALYFTALYYIVLHCIALDCTGLQNNPHWSGRVGSQWGKQWMAMRPLGEWPTPRLIDTNHHVANLPKQYNTAIPIPLQCTAILSQCGTSAISILVQY